MSSNQSRTQFFHWRDLQVDKQGNVRSTHYRAKKLLTKTVKSAIRNMCYREKTHNLSKYMATKLLVQTVPRLYGYDDTMLEATLCNREVNACERMTLACLRNRLFTYKHVQRKIANSH